MFKENPLPIILFSCIVVLVTAVMQYLQPEYSFFDGGYIIAILLTIFLKDDGYTRLFGFLGMTMALVSSFYPDSPIPSTQLLLQHLFSGVVIIMTMMLVIYQKKLYRSLEREKRQVFALFEYANEGIILTNGRGEMILVNPEAERLFGFEKSELLYKKIEILIPRDSQAKHEQYREQFNQNPISRRMGQGRDLFARRKDGSEFPVEVSLSHFHHKKEKFVIAFIIDISQRKEAEKNLTQQRDQLEKVTNDVKKLNANLETKVEERTLILKEALQELERSQHELEDALSKEKELNEIKSRFVSMASHEFRTPLSTILSSASLIGRYVQAIDQPQREKHISRVKDAVNHLNDLLEDFLSFGKLEEGKVETQISLVNIFNLVLDVLEELKPLLKEDQSFNTFFISGAEFYTDKRLIKHVLINLLSNAIKFSTPGKSIDISVEQVDAKLLIAVKDEGIGIAPEDIQYLFDIFFRAKNAFNIQGTGLGLHIVKRYIGLLNGEIFVDSVLQKGTKISVAIPEPPVVNGIE